VSVGIRENTELESEVYYWTIVSNRHQQGIPKV